MPDADLGYLLLARPRIHPMIPVAMKRMIPTIASQKSPLIAKPTTATIAHAANKMMMSVNMLLTVHASTTKRNRYRSDRDSGIPEEAVDTRRSERI